MTKFIYIGTGVRIIPCLIRIICLHLINCWTMIIYMRIIFYPYTVEEIGVSVFKY